MYPPQIYILNSNPQADDIGSGAFGLSGDPGLVGEGAFLPCSFLCFLRGCLYLYLYFPGPYQKLVVQLKQNAGATHGQGHQGLLCFW